MLENIEIRMMVSEARLTYRQIARHIGVTSEYLSKCMRYPLKPTMYLRVVKAINDLRGDRLDDV